MDQAHQAQLQHEKSNLEPKIRSLLNSELKSVCKSEGLPCSGVKATLQARILQRLDDIIMTGDAPRLDMFRQTLYGSSSGSSYGSSKPSMIKQPFQTLSTKPFPMLSNPLGSRSSDGAMGAGVQSMTRPGLVFPNSPFYTIVESLTPTKDLPEVMHQCRNTVQLQISMSSEQCYRFQKEPNLRILLYCTADINTGVFHRRPEIGFPSQVELRVNDEQFTGNLRGIKKKPGTTRPADITGLVGKKNPGYTNVTITYAATDKCFSAVVNLVEKHPVSELVEKIRQGHVISKQTVLNDMRNKAKDTDILATSSVMSLKCPISATRMALPCRSKLCNHVQCFDAESFLQLQEQAPQWSCPTCQKVFTFEQLVVDQYVQEILQTTSAAVEQVTIEPNGDWKPGSHTDEFRSSTNSIKGKLPIRSSSDDIVEIQDFRPNGSKSGQSSTPQSFMKSPNQSSREASTAASTAPTTTPNKRPQDNVIDLTLDSDDDEPPQRPVKRQSFGNTLQSSQPRSSLAPMTNTSSGGYSFGLPTYQHNFQPPNNTPPFGGSYW